MASNKNLYKRKIRAIKLIDSMNSWVGSWLFLILHIILFTFWLAWGKDINTLTLIVSLEAIILMILLLMSQNRQAIRDDLRDEADLQADLRSVTLVDKVLKEIKLIKEDINKLKK